MFRITNDKIIKRLIDRFSLQVIERERTLLSQTIVPVTLIDDIVDDVIMERYLIDVSSIGGKTAYSVSHDERLKLIMVYVSIASGTFTIGNIHLANPDVSSVFVLKAQAAQTYMSYGPVMLLPLVPPFELKVSVDGYTSVGVLNVDMYYTRDEVSI